jgi:hypothetical protein
MVFVFVWRIKADSCVKSTSIQRNAQASLTLAPVKNIKIASAPRWGLAADKNVVTHSHETGRRSVFSTGHLFTVILGHNSCSAAWLIMAWVGTITARFHVAPFALG